MRQLQSAPSKPGVSSTSIYPVRLGSVQFYIDDAPVGAPWGTTGKMRVEPGERLYVNASLGNGSNGDNCELEWIKVWYEV
jgi:hypothetical protein